MGTASASSNINRSANHRNRDRSVAFVLSVQYGQIEVARMRIADGRGACSSGTLAHAPMNAKNARKDEMKKLT